jgi:hypothetical protein
MRNRTYVLFQIIPKFAGNSLLESSPRGCLEADRAFGKGYRAGPEKGMLLLFFRNPGKEEDGSPQISVMVTQISRQRLENQEDINLGMV